MHSREKPWLLTASGIRRLDNHEIPGSPFQDKKVTAGAVGKKRAAVIVEGSEVWILDYGVWEKAAECSLTLNCVAWTRKEQLLVGTAEARLGRVSGQAVVFLDSFDTVPERAEWNTPWGGPPDTRSLAVALDGTIYANIHVGWIVCSRDDGRTWQSVRTGLEKDVHQVAVDPVDPAIVFAATAQGFHISYDHGQAFSRMPGSMPYLYQRACTALPGGTAVLASTARGPHGQADALLYRSEDGGQTWKMVHGLPGSVSRNIDSFQVFAAGEQQVLAVIEDTQLYESNDTGKTWEKKENTFPKIYAFLLNTA